MSFEKEFMPKKKQSLSIPPTPPEKYKVHELELEIDDGDEQIIKILRSRVEEFKALKNFNVEKQDDKKSLSSNEIMLPAEQTLINEIIKLIGMLGKELENQSAHISSIKNGDIESLDALLPSYSKLFPEKNSLPRDASNNGAPTEL